MNILYFFSIGGPTVALCSHNTELDYRLYLSLVLVVAQP